MICISYICLLAAFGEIFNPSIKFQSSKSFFHWFLFVQADLKCQSALEFCLSCFLFRSFSSLSPNSFRHSGRAVFIQAFGRCQQLRLCLSTPWCYHYTVGKCHRQLTAQPRQTHTSTGIQGIWFKGLVYWSWCRACRIGKSGCQEQNVIITVET